MNLTDQASHLSAAPTTADLRVHKAEAMLLALRAEFALETGDSEWACGSVLAVARKRIADVSGLVYAEPGDLLLVQRDPCRETVRGLPPVDVAWSPRAYAFTQLQQGDAEDVITGRM